MQKRFFIYALSAILLLALLVLLRALAPHLALLTYRLPRESEFSNLRDAPEFKVALLEGWNLIEVYELNGEEAQKLEEYNLSKCRLTVDRAVWTRKGLALLAGNRGRDRHLYLLKGEERCPRPLNLPDLKYLDMTETAYGVLLLSPTEILEVYLNSGVGYKRLEIEGVEGRVRYITSKREDELVLASELDGGTLLYFFKVRGEHLMLQRERRLNYYIAFPELSPSGRKLAYIVRCRRGFNLEVMKDERVERLTYLPPNTMVWMRPLFLDENRLLIAADYKGGFRSFIVELSDNTWYPLPLPQSFMIWPLSVTNSP